VLGHCTRVLSPKKERLHVGAKITRDRLVSMRTYLNTMYTQSRSKQAGGIPALYTSIGARSWSRVGVGQKKARIGQRVIG